MSLIGYILAFSAGVLAWTFTEYAVHRFDGHGFRVLIPNHIRHHADPVDYEVLHTPVRTIVLVMALWTLLGWATAGALLGVTFSSGFVVGYRYYEWLHDRLHDSPPRNVYGSWARRHHFHHHFQNPKKNHGVTTPLWDVLFGTYQVVRSPIRVPRAMAMPWLLDTVGQVRGQHTSTYCLR